MKPKNRYSFILCQNIPWVEIEKSPEANIYKTHNWFNHLVDACCIEPFVLEVYERDKMLGWFVAGKFSILGVTILGSPFEGWGTSYMGLSLKEEVGATDRFEIYWNLKEYVFSECHIMYLQISDWSIDYCHLPDNICTERIESYILDLSKEEYALFRSFKQKSCQYSIKKAQKLGVVVREPSNLNEFGHEYYRQLVDVFLKQNMKPTYTEERVQSLLRNLNKDKDLVVLEALHPESQIPMASVIFIQHDEMAFYWGAASWREYQKYCPNEVLMYEGMKILKSRGCKYLEMEGIRPYKEKYNPVRYSKPKLVFAKYPYIISLKNAAKSMYYKIRLLKSKIKG